jgi:hypothetical protein
VANGLTYVEADPEGWWYTALLPEGRRVLAFHTDADLPAATEVYTAVTLLARAGQLQVLTAMLADTTF